MCIAIVKPLGVAISEERLRVCFENNPDGAGFAYKTPNGLVVVKGLFDIEKFLAAYREHGVEATDALIHFRITTRGDGSADNCHPFVLSSGALIHNGTISGLGEVGKGKSDTAVLAEQLFAESFSTLSRLSSVIERSVQGTRVAIMSHAGETLVLNRDQWTEDGGATYSNDTFEPYAYAFSGKELSSSWMPSRNHYGRKYETASFMGGTSYPAYDNDYISDEADEDEAVDNGVELMEIDTIDATYTDGFFWCNGELWLARDGATFQRDTDLEEEILDHWFTEHGIYPRAQDTEELIDATRWYVESEMRVWDTSEKTNYQQKAA